MSLDTRLRQNKDIRNILNTLKNRLNTATYEEDLIETLQSIYKISLSDPLDVIETCFDSVIKSFEKTDEKSYQIFILHSLFTSFYSEISIKMLISNNEYSSILLNCEIYYFAKLIRTINSENFYLFLSNNDLIVPILIDLIKNEYFDEFCLFLENNLILKENIVFEGGFEEILKIYTLEKRKSIKDQTIPHSRKCLISLLKGSIKNQQYFFDSEVYLQIINELVFYDLAILEESINKESKNYQNNQKLLFKYNVATLALKNKSYSTIFKLIESNEDNFKKFVENYLELKTLIFDLDNSNDLFIFKIVELVARFTYFKIESASSFKINLLLSILDQSFTDLSNLILENIKNLNMDHLIYILITKNTIDDIKDSLYYLNYDEPLSLMCILIYLSFNIPTNLTISQINSKLKRLRVFLIQNEVTLDSINESIISTIDQYLQQYKIDFEKREYVLNEVKKTEVEKTPIQETKNVIEDVNSRIKGLFSKFTKSYDEKQTYDL